VEWYDRFRRSAAQILDSETRHRITGWFAGAREEPDPVAAPAPVSEDVFGELPPGLGVLDVMQLSLEAVQSVVARYRLASYPPDVMISVPKNACRTLDFHRGAEMIALGREVTTVALEGVTPCP
jgi:NTE family protein